MSEFAPPCLPKVDIEDPYRAFSPTDTITRTLLLTEVVKTPGFNL